MEFVKAYNAATESQRGNVIPVEITVYEDRSFTFITKTHHCRDRTLDGYYDGLKVHRRNGRRAFAS